jgi:membrane protease YdiL (CAAX protease family)
MNKTDEPIKRRIIKTWGRLPIVVRAILTGFLVSTLGVLTWPILGTTLPMPWSFLLMTGILWAYLKYFSGSWGKKSTRKTRSAMFRKTRLSRRTWILSILSIALIVLIEQSGLVVTFRMMEFPAERFSSEYDFINNIPVWAGWLAIIMISAVAGICEEVGFRGYMQVPLEKRYSPLLSITIVSVVFVLVHLHQAWSGPILLDIFFISVLFGSVAYYSGSLIPGIIAHFIMDICNFAFWWSDLGGQFDRQAISTTGVDSHFIIWLLVLIISIAAFILTLKGFKLNNR